MKTKGLYQEGERRERREEERFGEEKREERQEGGRRKGELQKRASIFFLRYAKAANGRYKSLSFALLGWSLSKRPSIHTQPQHNAWTPRGNREGRKDTRQGRSLRQGRTVSGDAVGGDSG